MTPLRIPVAIVSLAVFSLFLSGCKASDVTPESGEQKVSVRVSEVTGGERQDMPLRFSGIVRATQRATLTFQVSGTLRERVVELGQKVQAGDLLARVYNPGLEPARDSVRAWLEELRTQYQQAQRAGDGTRRWHGRGV